MNQLKPLVFNALNYYHAVTGYQNVSAIIFTGNGLGGSLAELLSIEYLLEGLNFVNVPVELYTFGAPPLGNTEFQNFEIEVFKDFLDYIDVPSRVTYNADPCPFYPEWGAPVPTEIYYYPNGTVRVCGKKYETDLNPNCSLQWKIKGEFDFEDHFKFFRQDARKMVESCLN